MCRRVFLRLFFPFLLYHTLFSCTVAAAGMLLGTDEGHYAQCSIAGALCTLPVMCAVYAADGKRGIGKTFAECREDGVFRHVLMIIFIALPVGTALNNMILMSPLVAASEGFGRANRYFFGSRVVFVLASSAVLTPVLEELVFRGILYRRMREDCGMAVSVLVSSLIFGVVHFNIVQFAYALPMGVLLALVMERCGNLYGAAVAHIAVNFMSVLRAETGVLEGTADGSARAWAVSFFLLFVGAAAGIFYLENRFFDSPGESIFHKKSKKG